MKFKLEEEEEFLEEVRKNLKVDELLERTSNRVCVCERESTPTHNKSSY